MSEFLLYIDKQELIQRILNKCSYKDHNADRSDQCWIYNGHDDGKGYKKVSILGRSYYVHRIMYILNNIQPELKPRHDLDHKCMNRSCCNPYHMQPLTRLTHNRKTHQGRKRCPEKKTGPLSSPASSLPASSTASNVDSPSISSIKQECGIDVMTASPPTHL